MALVATEKRALRFIEYDVRPELKKTAEPHLLSFGFSINVTLVLRLNYYGSALRRSE